MPQDNSTRLADLLFEASMLKQTPRSGYQFLGSGSETVAAHSFGCAVTGYVLASMAGADPARVALMCLFHDLHEARTGDANYVNKTYLRVDADRATADALAGTGLEEAFLPLWEELEQRESLEARLAHDADQLDLMVRLKEELDRGNAHAADWLAAVEKRLVTDQARQLAASLKNRSHREWWQGAVHRPGSPSA